MIILMSINRCRLKLLIALFCTVVVTSVNAGISIVTEGYLLLNEKNLHGKTYLWNGAVSNQVSELTQNWNLPYGEGWGVSNRYPLAPESNAISAMPYSLTDPGFTGPNGESYGIEVEFGVLDVPPRSQNGRHIRFYTDFGQNGITASGVDRAEVHIRSTLQKLNVKEGSTLWIGWSEYYTYLDTSRFTTIFQFRNQPSVEVLRNNRFSESEISQLLYMDDTDAELHPLLENNYIEGGPACSIATTVVEDNLHYYFEARDGYPQNWSAPIENRHTTSFSIEKNVWYDFVVQMTYSQDESGRYRVWVYESESADQITSESEPEWDYIGPTMYTYPDIFNKDVSSPEIRFGLYRFNAAGADDIDESNRYMNRYVGPMRFWVGENESGFEHVKPR